MTRVLVSALTNRTEVIGILAVEYIPATRNKPFVRCQGRDSGVNTAEPCCGTVAWLIVLPRIMFCRFVTFQLAIGLACDDVRAMNPTNAYEQAGGASRNG